MLLSTDVEMHKVLARSFRHLIMPRTPLSFNACAANSNNAKLYPCAGHWSDTSRTGVYRRFSAASAYNIATGRSII